MTQCRLRGGKEGQKRRAARGDVLCSCTCLDAHHISQGFRTFESCTCMLCRKVSFGVNAAEHNRTVLRAFTTQTIRDRRPHMHKEHTGNFAGSFLFLPLAPRRAAAYESTARLTHWVSLSTTSRIRTKPQSNTNKNAPAAVTLHGSRRETAIAYNTSDVQIDLWRKR